MNADQNHDSQSEPPNVSIGEDSNQTLVNNDINTSHATDQKDKSSAISQFDEDLSNPHAGQEDTAVAALDVRFGMFLCTRKSSSDGYRIALLWRKDTSTVQDGSTQFGKVLYAAQISAFLREQDAVTKESYEYLGPNCCLFKSKLRVCVHQSFIICFLYIKSNKQLTSVLFHWSLYPINNHASQDEMQVYRCYDNRLRCTERRPNVYEEYKGIKEHCRVVLHIEHRNIVDTSGTISGKSHEFGQLAPYANTEKNEGKLNITAPDWLWNYNGQLKVIQIPYHKGLHYAKCRSQLLPIVDFLEQMHENNYVHGDIRAYNMVLNYSGCNPQGWLIDFDFGGSLIESDPPNYPSRYVDDLPDGLRLGEPGKSITRDHDWYALGQIIFGKCYGLNHANIGGVPVTVKDSLLVDLPKKFKAAKGDYSKFEEGAATFLRDYLCIATKHGFELDLAESFSKSLERNGWLPQSPNNSAQKRQQNDSKGATGSPPKATN
jgi:serine/threonine protein kinase